jgi:hypothetical protein
MSDTPLLNEFDPQDVPWQYKALNKIKNLDFNLGVHQILLSGSVGSAKSLLMAHLVLLHCLENAGAICGVGRLTMPDLKDTFLKMILDHMGESGEIVEYSYNKTEGEITFPNGSKILSFSWHDKKYKKFRSYAFSMFAIEELTENDTPDAYEAIIMRLGRNKKIDEKLLLMATNPDDPEHWAYKKIIESKEPTKHVFYSLTKDNKFLPSTYIDYLERNLDPKMADRMLRGLWVPIAANNIYYSYSERNQRKGNYTINEKYPIRITWDFNIGEGKPMSCVAFQWNRYAFHWFKEFVVHSARTSDILEEIAASGLLDHRCAYVIHGDATGKNRDTRSKLSDYDIIDEFLANYRTPDGKLINYSFEVGSKNPPIRTRHNLMNAQMQNVKGETRFHVYVDQVPTLHEGLRLTKLKPGGQYIEDDSKYYQHITTAAGYGVSYCILSEDSKPQGMVIL